MLRGMSSKQFYEWQLFEELEPFGPERADQRAGVVSAAIHNAHRDRKKKRKPFTMLECSPTFGDTPVQKISGAAPGVIPEGWHADGPATNWKWMKALGKAMTESHNEQLVKNKKEGPRVSQSR